MALIAAMATCVEQPTSPRDAGLANVHLHPAAVATGVSHQRLTAGNSRADLKTCTTVNIAPAANALVTVAVMGHNTTAASPSPDRHRWRDGGLGPGRDGRLRRRGDAAQAAERLPGAEPSPGSGHAQDHLCRVQANCQWIVSQWQGVETSGTNGSGAIAQSGSARGDNVNGADRRAGRLRGPERRGVRSLRRPQQLGLDHSRRGVHRDRQAGVRRDAAVRPRGRTVGRRQHDRRPVGRLNGGALGIEIRAAAPAVIPVASVAVSPESGERGGGWHRAALRGDSRTPAVSR